MVTTPDLRKANQKDPNGPPNPLWEDYKDGLIRLQTTVSGQVINDWDYKQSVQNVRAKAGNTEPYELGERAFPWERIPSTPLAWYVPMKKGVITGAAKFYIILKVTKTKDAIWQWESGLPIAATEVAILEQYVAKKKSSAERQGVAEKDEVKFRLYKFEGIQSWRMDNYDFQVQN